MTKTDLFQLKIDTDGKHKFYVNTLDKRGNYKKVHFGGIGYKDYTIYYKEKGKDYADKMKHSYLSRHSKNGENWNNPTTAGYYSRWVLWNLPNVEESWKWVKQDLKNKGYI